MITKKNILLYSILFLLTYSCSNVEHLGRTSSLYSNSSRSIANEKTVVLGKKKVDGHNFVVEKINGTELLNESVSKMLYEEQVLHVKALWGPNAFATPMRKEYWPENQPKFALPYYLIPEEDADFIKTDGMSSSIFEQVNDTNSEKKFYKLFVHPESYNHYKFLRGHYTFIGPDETEFTASPTSSYRSLLVWNNKEVKEPFIAKVTLDTTIISSISRVVKRREVLRSIANQKAFELLGEEELRNTGADIYKETSGLNLKDSIKFEGMPDILGGQIIRELSPSVLKGEVEWVSLAAVMSPERKEGPLVMDMIKKSGLTAKDFLDKFFIDSYMDMFEKLSFKEGMNFEPHSQNLSMEVKDGVPTGIWVQRDFGGMWPDIIKMIENNKLQKAYLDFSNAEDFYFLGSRSNFAASYAFFYKRQVFDMVVKEVRKHEQSLSLDDVKELNNKIDGRMKSLISSVLLHTEPIVPTMSNYKSVGRSIQQEVKFDDKLRKYTASTQSEFDMAKQFIELKKTNDEWVPYASAFNSENVEYILGNDGIYIVDEGRIVGFGLFNYEELKIINENSLNFKTLSDKMDALARGAPEIDYRKRVKLPSDSAGSFCKRLINSFFGR